MNIRKTAQKFALIVVFNVLLLELLCLLFVHSLAIIRPSLRLDLTIDQHFATITDQDLSKFWSARDELLGWDSKPFQSGKSTNSAGATYSWSYGADGSRNDHREHNEVLISTYGDSFTAGDEVNNDETWQRYLEGLVGYDVKNFGTPGYGIGQSWLKLQSHFVQGRVAPITMLVVYEADLDRTVNNFRWFLNRHTGGKLAFKPSFRYMNGEVRFFPVPQIDESMTLDDLKALTIALARRDYGMTKWVYFVPQFPYTYQITKALPLITQKIIAKIRVDEKYESIWHTKEGRLILEHILKSFDEAAIEHGSIPVVVFIPDVSNWEDGRKIPPYHELKELLLNDATMGPLIIDIYDADFDEHRFSIQPFQGHASPYGNQAIATHLASKLKEYDLLK